jgi:predicted esterase
MAARRAFHAVAEEVFALHEAGRYRDALAKVADVSAAYPERAEKTAYWRACFHALLGEPEMAIGVLEVGIARGLWWAPDMLARDPDLAGLRERADFAEIVKLSEIRLEAARADARPALQVERPDSPDESSPLLIALHWRGSNPEDLNDRWGAATTLGVTVACPRSSQQLGMNSYGWDDRELAQREIAEAYRTLESSERFDPSQVIVGGLSQGGAVALSLALTSEIVPARGFIAVVPAIRHAELDEAVTVAARRGVRGWLLTGERDYGRADAEALHKKLVGAGVACRLEVVPGMEHDLPDDFEARLPERIDFVLGR